jgi:hypothetical protein
MPAIQDSLKRSHLYRAVVAEPDSVRRTEVIAHMRGLIAEERRIPQSAENTSYLTVAEMVLEFLEETLNSRNGQKVQ